MKLAYTTQGGTLAFGGQRVVMRPGDVWDADDPIVAAYPDFFTDQPRRVRSTRTPDGLAPIETATADVTPERGGRRGRR